MISTVIIVIGSNYSGSVGVRSIVINPSVCLSVCVSVCLSASISPEPLDRSSRIFGADPLWPWLGHPLAALHYVMYFRFYGWRHVLVVIGRTAIVALRYRNGVWCQWMPCFHLHTSLCMVRLSSFGARIIALLNTQKIQIQIIKITIKLKINVTLYLSIPYSI